MTKPYTGRPYQREDGRWENRIRSANNKIVAVSHDQGYENYADAMAVLVHLLHGGPHVLRRPNGTFARGTIGAWMKRRSWPRRTKPYTGTWYQRADGRWETRITADTPNNDVVFTSGVQGYENEADAVGPLEFLLLSGPHIVKDIDNKTVPLGVSRPTRRQVRKAIRTS